MRARPDANLYTTVNLGGGQYKLRSRIVAEQALGCPLPPGAEVHHVDGNRRNDVPSNLVICQDHGYHLLLHRRATVVKRGGNPNTQRLCWKCDRLRLIEEFYAHAGRCWKCRECSQAACRAYRRRVA